MHSTVQWCSYIDCILGIQKVDGLLFGVPTLVTFQRKKLDIPFRMQKSSPLHIYIYSIIRLYFSHKKKKKIRVGNLLFGFSSKSLLFCEPKSDSLLKKSKSLLSLFCTEQQERFAHSHSFEKSESLLSLFKKEQLSEEQRERFALGNKKGKSSEKLSKTYEN